MSHELGYKTFLTRASGTAGSTVLQNPHHVIRTTACFFLFLLEVFFLFWRSLEASPRPMQLRISIIQFHYIQY